MPVLSLDHDASRYFDIHHTVNDTLEKVDPDDLRYSVAAYATITWVVANVPGDCGTYPDREEPATPEPGAESNGKGASK